MDQHYGISKRFLEIAATKGEGPPFVRIGRSVKYRRADIEAWIDSCRVDPAETASR
nr:helix-turn-helix domain-containing protein [Maritimibacter sp. 55A14]